MLFYYISQLAERKLQDDEGQQCIEMNWTFLAHLFKESMQHRLLFPQNDGG